MNDLWIHFWTRVFEVMTDRVDGPFRFRLFLQPTIATEWRAQFEPLTCAFSGYVSMEYRSGRLQLRQHAAFEAEPAL